MPAVDEPRPTHARSQAGEPPQGADLEARRAAEPPQLVYTDDEFGVRVRGPHHKRDRRRQSLTRSYAILYSDPPHSPNEADHRHEQRRTKGKAVARAREIVRNFRQGARSDAAPRRHERLDVLLEANFDPANHPKGRLRGRQAGWGSVRIRENHRTLANWIRPLIGTVACEELATPLSNRADALDGLLPFAAVLHSMAVAGLAASTRQTHYRNLQGLVSFGRRAGFIPPDVEPLAGVVQPTVPRPRVGVPERWVPPEQIPTRRSIDVLCEVYRSWHERRRRWSEAYCWQWAQMPLVVAHTGLRFAEMLALRARDVSLDPDDPRVTVEWQIDRAGRRLPPKHGSRRSARYPVWLQPVLARLVAQASAQGGPDALLWPSLFDPTRPVRHDAFTDSYFHPQASVAHQRLVEEGKRGWEHDDVPEFYAPGVPTLRADGTQVVRRKFTHTITSLRHYYATIALTPGEQGGWGAAVHSLAQWMGHSSPQVTWEMYASHLDTARIRHLEATKVDPLATR